MPVDLEAIPDKTPRIPRPDTRRWLWFLVFCLVTGALITLWNWEEERSGGGFWFALVGLPVCCWGIAFSVRRIGYKCDQVWAASRDKERGRILQSEVARGQRRAYLIEHFKTTKLNSSGGDLMVSLLAGKSVITSEKPRHGDRPVRHSHLPMAADQVVSDLLAVELKKLVTRIAPVFAELPASMPCYVVLEVDSGLTKSEVDALWQQASSPLKAPLIRLAAQGLAALDSWLDHYFAAPSSLLIVTAQINPEPTDGSGEAVVGVLLTNRPVITRPAAVSAHRPEAGAMADLTKTLSRALLWANAQPEAVNRAWLTGEALANEGAWSGACENNQLTINTQTHCPFLDGVVGFTGCAAPWLALAVAAVQCEREAAVQLLVAQTSKERVWVGSVSPATTTREMQDNQS